MIRTFVPSAIPEDADFVAEVGLQPRRRGADTRQPCSLLQPKGAARGARYFQDMKLAVTISKMT
jgi:hypothetical protein